MTDIDARRLAADAAIRDLAIRYSVAVDDGDLFTVVDSFTADGAFERGDRVVRGSDELREFFSAASGTYALARHVVEMHTIDFDDKPGHASGIVHGSAQLVRDGVFHVAAFRYHDQYEQEAEGWRFTRRRLHYLYFLPAAELVDGIASEDRVRLPTIGAATEES